MWQECNQYIDQHHITNILSSPNCIIHQNHQTLDEISPPSLVVFLHWPSSSPSPSVVLTPNNTLVSRNLLEKPDKFSLRFPFPGRGQISFWRRASEKETQLSFLLLPSLGFDSEMFFLFAFFMQPNETGQQDC